MKSFGQLLVERIKNYFRKKYGIDLTDEQADEALDSLAGLIAVLSESGGGLSPPETLKRSGGADHPAS